VNRNFSSQISNAHLCKRTFQPGGGVDLHGKNEIGVERLLSRFYAPQSVKTAVNHVGVQEDFLSV
jgi:hypothetical protein